MSVSNPTPENVKEKAKLLRSILQEKHGLDIPHGHCMELISKLFGFKSWNVASAALKSNPKSVKASAPTFVSTVGELKKSLDGVDDSTQIIFWNILIVEALLSMVKTLNVSEGVLHNEYSLIRGDTSNDQINFQLKLEHQDLKSHKGDLIF